MKGFHGCCGRMQHTEGGAHPGGDADGGCATNDHLADGFGDFPVVGEGVGNFLGGETAVVEDDHSLARPFGGLGYVNLVENLNVMPKSFTEMERGPPGPGAPPVSAQV